MKLGRNTIIVSCSLLCLSMAVESPASKPSPSPSWSSEKIASIPRNQSYFVQTKPIVRQGFNDQIFLNDSDNRQVRQEMQREFDQFENRKNAGVAEASDEKGYFEKMKDITKSAMEGLGRVHAKAKNVHLKNYAETSLTDVKHPLGAAVLAAALYRGKLFRFRVSEDVSVESHTKLKDKDASVSMVIPGLTSSIYYTKETSVAARVSKHIVDNISAEVNVPSAAQSTLQLKYGITF